MANASDTPEERSINEFMRAVRQHDKVSAVSRNLGEFTVEISLKAGTTLRVLMTNIYCIGEADVREFLDNDPRIDVIVTLSAWNLVSEDAASYGREKRKGVFTWKEFFGALNYKKYWLYEDIPYGLDNKELVAERRRRRSAWN
jgi:hypothetical protein